MSNQISPPETPSLSSCEAAVAGLAKRMNQVTRLLKIAGTNIPEKVTHDLRVAIRRCRSVASGAKMLDPDGQWSRMSKELRRVFRALGHLRDLHVMRMWVDKIGKASDPVSHRVTAILRRREITRLDGIRDALDQFDQDSWKEWCETLPTRLQEILASSPDLTDMASDRLRDFLSVHQELLTNDLEETWHKARVALKRFRYTVENFLPDKYQLWGGDLEALQDILGEIHDLDVLGSYLISLNPLFDPSDRERWRRMIHKERYRRVSQYHHLMSSPSFLGYQLDERR